MKRLAKLLCLVMALSTVSFTAVQAAPAGYGTFTVDGVTFYARTSSTRGDSPLANAFDGDVSTVWQANAGGTKGHWVEFDFGEKKLLGGVMYQPVQESFGNGDYKGAMLQYQLEVSNDGEHYIKMVQSWQSYNKEMTERSMDTVYARYMRFREPNISGVCFFGTGAAEFKPIIREASSGAAPTVLGLEIHGTAMSGETLYGKYLYNSLAGADEGNSKYVWCVSGTKDGNYKDVAFGDTEEGIEYTVKPGDTDKYLRLAIIPVDKDGKTGARVWSQPVKILSDEEKTAVAGVIASFDAQVDAMDAENIVMTGTSSNLTMPSVDGADISYSCDNQAYLSNSGAVLKQAAYAGAACAYPAWEKDGVVKSLYTAAITYDGIKFTRDFRVSVRPEGTKPAAEETVYPSYVRNADDAVGDMGLSAVETTEARSGSYAYYKTLSKTYGYYDLNAFAVNAKHITGQKTHLWQDWTKENWNTNTYSFWNTTVGTDNITADTVWIARQFIKADPTGEVTEARNPIFQPTGVSGAPANVHRVAYAVSSTVNSTEWTELQMVGNRGSDPNYTKFGFMVYGAMPTAIYIDDIEMQELRIGSINISGNDSVEAGSSEIYSGTVLNQFGTTLGMEEITKTVTSGETVTTYPITPKQTVAYSLKSPVNGVSINAETGELSVAENAKPGNVTIVAKISTPTGFIGANGNVNDLKGRDVTAEKEVAIVNSNPFVITGTFVDGETLTASEEASWYIGKNPEGSFTALGSGAELTLANAGGKYIKAVSGLKSAVAYIEPKVDTGALFVYKDGARKADLTLEAGTLKAVSKIKNNTASDKKATVIIALYENGKLKGVTKGSAAVIPAHDSANVSAELDVTAGENDTAKIMIVDGDSVMPYEKTVTLNP